MPRSNRASQFAPFDALKGLNDALRLKEYEHERIVKNDIPEEKIIEISNTLANISKADIVRAEYYDDGYIKNIEDVSKVFVNDGYILISNEKIKFEDLIDLKIVKKSKI